MPDAIKIGSRYEIKEPLGHGGMGVVYRAYDTVTKRDVALKTMRDIADPAALELFAKEWSVLATLSHPNIVDILDTGEFEDEHQRKPYFVMPLLPGKTLDKLIRSSSQRLTVERAVEIISQTCRGLQAAHDRGLVHRDLKPSNIFVMNDDTVKIIDFGVVHLTDSKSISGIKGTLQYMSPEQIEMKVAKPQSDIFSLGVVCYETVTGQKPFARQTEPETAEAVRFHIPPPASQLNPAVNELVSRVIHMAMAKQPWHRFSTARDFAENLQKALHNEPIERFDRARIQPRIERAKKAQAEGDLQFAKEILTELEAEGHMDAEMASLRVQLDQAIRQKSIRQLLDSARARFEEDEIPLALQKLQEVINQDPSNAEALGMKAHIEKQRSERQIENWFRLVRQHMDNQAFGQARQGLQELLKINSREAKAIELLAEVDRREQELLKFRNEKEQLYQAAQQAYQNGEISTALSKLEKVLELNRRTPDSAVPEREAIYQSLYNQLRNERESIRNAYAEGRRNLTDRNFGQALAICDQFLKKYPADPLFQALKLEAEEQTRQERSAFIAEIGRRADAEPNLDRRVNILQEAVDRYPDEIHLQQSLRLIRERRDLMNAIISRARQYESNNQFNEALGQWEILRSIYSQYPGLDVEIDRLVRRREQQAREDAKARLVEQIDRSLESGHFAKARDLARSALAEFPDDQELAGLERLARQGIERSAEAEQVLDIGRKLCAESHFAEALEKLRHALELDERNPAVRTALLDALVQQAQSLLDRDWHAAEPLIQEALEMDAGHPLAQSLRTLILDRKRKEFVDQCVTEARELQSSGRLEAALRKVEEGLTAYPNDVRLIPLRTTLNTALTELRRRQPRNQQLDDSPPQALDRKQPDGINLPEAAEAQVAAGQTSAKTEIHLGVSPTLMDVSVGGATDLVGADRAATSVPRDEDVVVPSPCPSRPATVDKPQERQAPARLRQAGEKLQVVLGNWKSEVRGVLREIKPALARGRKWKDLLSPLQWLAIAAVPFLLLSAYIAIRSKTSPKPLQPAAKEFVIDPRITPRDATLKIDGRPVTYPIKLTEGPHRAEAFRDGYKSDAIPFTLTKTMSSTYRLVFDLTPEPPVLRLLTDLPAGKILLDEKDAGDLHDGGLVRTDLEPGDHTLKVLDKSVEIVSVSFRLAPGAPPHVVSPVKGRDLVVVIGNLGNRTRILSNTTTVPVNLKDQPPQPLPAEGIEMSLNGPNQLQVGDAKKFPIEIGNSPMLSIWVNSNTNVGALMVEANEEDATVFLNGAPQRRRIKNGKWFRNLEPKTYAVRVSKEGFQEVPEQQAEVQKDKPQKLTFVLQPVMVSASLAIHGAPSDATVWIDGTKVGEIKSGTYAGSVHPGDHTIELKKQNCEGAPVPKTFSSGASVSLAARDFGIQCFGFLEFKITPPNALVTFQREGDQGSQQVKDSKPIRVREGQYTISASAEKFKPMTPSPVAVSAGQSVTIPIKLIPIEEQPTISHPSKAVTNDQFQNPRDWILEDGWWYHQVQGYSYLKRTGGSFSFNFLRTSKKVVFVTRAVPIEWVIGYKNVENRLVYVLDEKMLRRKWVSDGRPLEVKRHHSMGAKEIYQIQISIEPTRVVVKDADGNKIDDFEQPAANFTDGKFGFKGKIALTIPE